jgi:hypothetical protein
MPCLGFCFIWKQMGSWSTTGNVVGWVRKMAIHVGTSAPSKYFWYKRTHCMYILLFIWLTVVFFFFFFWWDWDLNSNALPLEPHLQTIFAWLFWRWNLVNYLLRLTLNCNPPNFNLSLTSN